MDFQKIDAAHDLKIELDSLRITVPLSMFSLDGSILNEDLSERAQKLKDRLITYEVEENRELNNR